MARLRFQFRFFPIWTQLRVRYRHIYVSELSSAQLPATELIRWDDNDRWTEDPLLEGIMKLRSLKWSVSQVFYGYDLFT